MSDKLTMVVAGVGTGGTITGIASRIKQTHPHVKVVGYGQMLLILLNNIAYISQSLTKAVSASCDIILSEQPLLS